MAGKKYFKRVLAQYLKYILQREKGFKNKYAIDFGDLIWYNTEGLDSYFNDAEIPRILNRYFVKIDPKMKSDIVKRYPDLKKYFNEDLWHSETDNLSAVDYSKPSTSGYRSPGTQSIQNSPIRNSKTVPPLIITRHFVRKGKNNDTLVAKYYVRRKKNTPGSSPERSISPVRSRSNSPERSPVRSLSNSPERSPVQSRSNSPESSPVQSRSNSRERSPIQSRSNSPKRSTVKKQLRKKKKSRRVQQPKRKYRKRLKLYPYLNELPDDVPSLKPNESVLLLQSLDGQDLNNLNLPLPICKTIRKQCRTYNPNTKRFNAYEDDGSDNIPLHLSLKY